jgi:hypothetical protein
MVIGLFSSPVEAATCLSNLAEADFGERDISIVMNAPGEVAAIARAAGPLNGISPDALAARLTSHGMRPADAAVYREAVRRGGVLIAVSAANADGIAAEMLRDHNAQNVRTIDNV